jgi:hypothetical protein
MAESAVATGKRGNGIVTNIATTALTIHYSPLTTAITFHHG